MKSAAKRVRRGQEIETHMNLRTNKTTIALGIASMCLVQSCAVIRSNIDESCVNHFADQYPVPQESRFVLPWRIDHSFKLTQGNCTFESHSLSNKQHMSFDFKMPIGTPILAADDGRIFIVVESYRDNIDKGFGEANYIGVEHSGGILTWYTHLMFEGSLVQVNDQVSRGETIGYSGNTGESSYPHLHFFAQQLIEECHDAEAKTANLAQCPQVPISFSNASPGDAVLKEWTTYKALAY